jgi:hypothetical protein
MRSPILAIAAALAALAASAATAQPAPSPPRLFAAAGYSQPEIGPSACRPVNASETRCAVPAMTAGVYLVRASATSTAQAADAAQQITIVAGDQSCTSTRSPDPKAPWPVGAKRTLMSGCVFTLLTDTPLAIAVIYLDAKAEKDPKGPQVTVTRAPWTGVLGGAMPVSIKQP